MIEYNVILNNAADYNGAQLNIKKEFHSLYISLIRSLNKTITSRRLRCN
jgi:hypothetical protein